MEIIEKVIRNVTRYYIANNEKKVMSITDIANNTDIDSSLVTDIGRFVGGRIYCSSVPNKAGICFKIEDFLYFEEEKYAENFLDAIVKDVFDPHKRMEYIIENLRKYKLNKESMDKLQVEIRSNYEVLEALGTPGRIQEYVQSYVQSCMT